MHSHSRFHSENLELKNCPRQCQSGLRLRGLYCPPGDWSNRGTFPDPEMAWQFLFRREAVTLPWVWVRHIAGGSSAYTYHGHMEVV